MKGLLGLDLLLNRSDYLPMCDRLQMPARPARPAGDEHVAHGHLPPMVVFHGHHQV